MAYSYSAKAEGAPVVKEIAWNLRAVQFKTITKAFKDYSARAYTDMKAEHNATIPKIHRLPNELIVKSLLWTRDDDVLRSSSDPRQLRILAGVCRFWQDIVMSFPQFWDRLNSLYDRTTAHLFLRRSGSVPLTVVLSHHVRPEFLDIIAPSSSRWKAVLLQAPFRDRVFALIRHLPPSVEDLNISRVIASHSTSHQPYLIEGSSPFKNVTLCRSHLNWGSPRLSNMSSLNLSYLTIPKIDALSIITASPGLEILCLGHITHPPGDSTPSLDRAVDLPILHKLVLETLEPSFALSVLQTSSFPNIRLLFVAHLSLFSGTFSTSTLRMRI